MKHQHLLGVVVAHCVGFGSCVAIRAPEQEKKRKSRTTRDSLRTGEHCPNRCKNTADRAERRCATAWATRIEATPCQNSFRTPLTVAATSCTACAVMAGYNAAISKHPLRVLDDIYAGVKRAVARKGEMKPFTFDSPVTVEIRYKRIENAQARSRDHSGWERIDAYTIRRTGQFITDIY